MRGRQHDARAYPSQPSLTDLREGRVIADNDHPSDLGNGRAWAASLVEAQPTQPGRGVAGQLHRLCLALESALGLLGAAVTVRSVAESEAVVAAASPTSRRLVEMEFGLGEGPSRDAFDRGKPVLVPELGKRLDGGWPAYTATAHASGVGGVFAFPLQVGASRFGVLTVFSRPPRRLDRGEVAKCLAMAHLATEMLVASSVTSVDGEIAPDLKSALGQRGEIYQAQGMVMVALRVSLAEALALMRARAFTEGRDLLDVSVDIIEGRLQLSIDRQDP